MEEDKNNNTPNVDMDLEGEETAPVQAENGMTETQVEERRFAALSANSPSLSETQQQLVSSIADGLMNPTEANPGSDASNNETRNEETQGNTSDTVREEINQWKQFNTYVPLEIVSISEPPEYCIQCTVGHESVPFQVFTNDQWQPLFITSSNEQIEEFITPINAQIEEQANSHPITITNLLNLLGIAYNENAQLQQRVATPGSSFTNFPIPPLRQVEEEAPPQVPTAEDWEQLIMPQVRVILNRENFQPYEVEEWIRRVTVQVQRGDYNRALRIIQEDILGWQTPPEEIAKFFSRRSRFSMSHLETPEEKKYITVDGTEEGTALLEAELAHLKEMNTKEMGFTAGPSGNDLYHWHVRLSGFGNDTPLGQGLTEWAVRHTNIEDSTQQLDQDILLEMKFPTNFPAAPPLIRIIRPRLKHINADLTNADEESSSLSFSQTIENKQARTWEGVGATQSITEIIQKIRSFIVESGTEVDLEREGASYSQPTVGGFWRSYRCVSSSLERSELENGGKIVLPPSALEELSQFDLESTEPYRFVSPFGSVSRNGNTPWIFEISSPSGRRAFCGIEEFTANEGTAIIPQWVLDNLREQSGTTVQVRRVELPKGSFLRLQPHTADFLEVNDTKAMLEFVLPRFVCMHKGDTIPVAFGNRKYLFNVLEVRPSDAVSIIDSDVTTDFAPPLSGEIATTVSTSPTSPIAIPGRGMDTTLAGSVGLRLGTSPLPVGSPGKMMPPSPLGSSPGIVSSPGQTSGILERDIEGVEGIDFKVCDNCRHRIPTHVYNNHVLSCVRRNWYCEICEEAFEKSQREVHMEESHSEITCECGEVMEKRHWESHRQNDCPQRIVQCDFCPLEMPYVQKYEHEQKCGAQTVKCETCQRYVTKKDLPAHTVECSKPKPSPTPTPTQQEDVMLCPVCQSPFLHLDDLQVHMLTSHSDASPMEDENDGNNTAVDTKEPEVDEMEAETQPAADMDDSK